MSSIFEEILIIIFLFFVLFFTNILQLIVVYYNAKNECFGGRKNVAHFVTFVAKKLTIRRNILSNGFHTKDKYKGFFSLPGPRPFPFPMIGNLFQLPKNADEFIPKCVEWCKKYGSCFRLTVFGKHFVVISDPTIAQQSVLQSNQLEHLTKSELYGFMKEIKGLAFTNGERWRTMRKLAASVFNYQTMEKRVEYSNTQGDNLVSCLRNEFDKKNIELLIAGCTVDIIIDSFISGPLTCTHADSIKYVKSWKRYTEITTFRMMNPWLAFDFIWKRHPLHKEMVEIVNNLNQFVELLLQPHISKLNESSCNADNKTLISQLLKLNYPIDQIRNEVLTMLFGYEAFFFGLYYLIFMLASHPEHQEKCREEVDYLRKKKSTENQGNKIFYTTDDLSKLKYLERCFLETLRLLPPAVIFGRKLEADLRLENGIFLPSGTNALIAPFLLHKMSEYYPNPETFDPDRFLPENSASRHPFAFLPFSAGPRICLGMKSAIVSAKIVVAKILENFIISSPHTLGDIKFTLSLAMVPKESLDLVFTPRK